MHRSVDNKEPDAQTGSSVGSNSSIWDRNADGTWVYPEELRKVDRTRRDAAIAAGALAPATEVEILVDATVFQHQLSLPFGDKK